MPTWVKIVDLISIIVGAIGAIFAAPSAIALLISINDRSAQRRLSRTPALRGGDLSAVSVLPRLVTVSGTTCAGPAGEQVAPWSGVRCVWYRLRVWQEHDTADGKQTEVVWEQASSDSIGLSDGTGLVLVSARLFERDLAGHDDPRLLEYAQTDGSADGWTAVADLQRRGVVPGDVTDRLGKDNLVWVREEVVLAGRAIVVLGSVRLATNTPGTALIRPSLIGRCGISVDTLDEVRRDVAAQGREYWRTARIGGSFGLLLMAIGYPVHVVIDRFLLAGIQ